MDESIFLCVRVAGEVVATQEESGAVTGINRLQVALARQDLDAQWQCRVHSPALPSSLVANLRIDVHGKPVFFVLSFSHLAVQNGHITCHHFDPLSKHGQIWPRGK